MSKQVISYHFLLAMTAVFVNLMVERKINDSTAVLAGNAVYYYTKKGARINVGVFSSHHSNVSNTRY